jgi:hypothetical protein
MIPHVLLCVQSFGTVLALEPVVCHLVSLDHVGPQLCLQNVLHQGYFNHCVGHVGSPMHLSKPYWK